MDKKGLNQIVGTFIIIALIFVAVLSIWVIVKEVTKDLEKRIEITSPGSIEIPKSNSESCKAEWQCGEWTDCSPAYGLQDLLSKDIFLKEEQYRECSDSSNCFYNKIVKQECDILKSVTVNKVVKCGKEYIELYDSGRIVSRLELKERGLNIQIILGEVAYCDHCYNNKLDEELGEKGVDCVNEKYGICPQCTPSLHALKFDYLLIVALIIFFMIIVYVILFKSKKHERKRIKKKKQLKKKIGKKGKTEKKIRKIKKNIKNLKKKK